MRIKWVGPIYDPSGYGVANRDYIKALHQEGCQLTLTNQHFVSKDPTNYGETGQLLRSLENTDLAYDIVVHHYVPNKLEGRIEPGKINIGYNTWETDKIPDHWVYQINKLDLLMVPSHFNKSIYQRCGVTIPIEVIPHCVDIEKLNTAPETSDRFSIPNIENRYKFFSVFQWTERKNPINLLKGYFSAFYGKENDNVVLVLKTYRSNTSYSERLHIIKEINQLKEDMCFTDNKKCPPVALLTDLVTDEEMHTLYKMHDCFVLPTRAEGFGLPILEAMLHEKPIITTNYSGHLDFCHPINDSKKAKNGKQCVLLPYQLTPVAHMKWIPYYDGTQLWAEPSVFDLKICMQYTFYGMYPHNAKQARERACQKYNYKTVANDFINAIKDNIKT